MLGAVTTEKLFAIPHYGCLLNTLNLKVMTDFGHLSETFATADFDNCCQVFASKLVERLLFKPDHRAATVAECGTHEVLTHKVFDFILKNDGRSLASVFELTLVH